MSADGFAAEHAEVAEALGAYVLRALPDDELAVAEAHLPSCGSCRAEVASLQTAADALPISCPPIPAPGELHDRIMAVVDAEAELLQAAGSGADRASEPGPRRGRRRLPRLGALSLRPVVAASAAAVLLAVGAAGGVTLLGDDGPQVRTLSADVLDPSLRASTSASVRLKGTHASLVVRDLPEPPAGRVYQVWVKKPGRAPAPADAQFSVRTGTIEIPHEVHPSETVLVTSEPAGGSSTPTRTPLIVARAT